MKVHILRRTIVDLVRISVFLTLIGTFTDVVAADLQDTSKISSGSVEDNVTDNQITSAYATGDLVGVQAAFLTRFRASGSKFGSLADANLATDVLALCELMYDYECINDVRFPLLAYYVEWLEGKHGDISEFEHRAIFMRHGYQLAASSRTFVGAKPEWARDTLQSGRLDLTEEFAWSEPAVFIDRRILLADLHQAVGNRAVAREALEGALAALLSVKNPEDSPYLFFAKTIEVLDRFWVLSDHRRITKFVKLLSPIAEQHIPPKSPEMFRFLALQAVVALENGDALASMRFARQLLDWLASAKLSKAARQNWTYQAGSALWSGAIVAGDEKSAVQAITIIAQSVDLSRATQNVQLENDSQALALSMSGLTKFMFGKRISALERKLLLEYRKGLTPALEFGLTDYIDILLFFDSVDSRTSSEQILSAAQNFLSTIKRIGARDSFDHIPQPPIEVRISCALFLGLIAERLSDSPAAVDIAVSLGDILTRKVDSTESTIKALLSQASTPDEQFLIRQGFSFLTRKNNFETAQLERIVNRFSSVANTNRSEQDVPTPVLFPDLRTHFIFGDYYRQLEKWRSALRGEPSLASATFLADSSSIKSNLLTDAAVLIVTATSDDAVYVVCVSNNGVSSVRRATLGARDIRRADKIISLSLTATHRADGALDSQFPVREARLLYDQLVLPSSTCIGTATRMSISVPADFITTPFSILLSDSPSVSEHGYDLRTAPWLMQRFSLTQEASPLGLAFAAKSFRSGGMKKAFLGVGDPVLRTPQAEASLAGVSLRGVNSTIGGSTLNELPETSDELKKISRLFPNSSELLVRESGSEGEFRSKNLSAFKYIGLATHGVLREEYEGLIEPALILTPIVSGADDNDGILTTSEIGDLTLDADVVALTACNSASHDLREFSIGLPSLASAFLVAGAKQVLATRWPVDSGAASTISTLFFQYLSKMVDGDGADALRFAQQQYVNTSPDKALAHPRFWAAFSIYGGDPSRNKASTNYNAGLRLGELSMLPGVGEIIAATSLDSGEKYIALSIGPADPLTKIHPKQIVEISKQGTATLVRRTEGYFYATIHTTDRHSVFALSAKFQAESNTTAISLDEISLDGLSINSTPLPVDGLFVATAKLEVLADGGILVFLTGHQIDNILKLIVLRLNPQKKVIAVASIKLRDGVDGRGLAAVESGNRVVISVANLIDISSENNPAPMKLVNHPLKALKGCSNRQSSIVFNLDLRSMSLSELFSLQDVMITSLEADKNGSIIAAGTKSNCLGDLKVVAGQLHETSFETFFEDDSAIDTRLSDLVTLKNGEIIVAGRSVKHVDAESKLFTGTANIESLLDPERQVTSTNFLTLFRLTATGGLIERIRVMTGDSIYWNDIAADALGAYLIVGGHAVSGRGALTNLTVH